MQSREEEALSCQAALQPGSMESEVLILAGVTMESTEKEVVREGKISALGGPLSTANFKSQSLAG